MRFLINFVMVNNLDNTQQPLSPLDVVISITARYLLATAMIALSYLQRLKKLPFHPITVEFKSHGEKMQ
jgi:hypothetical protein